MLTGLMVLLVLLLSVAIASRIVNRQLRPDADLWARFAHPSADALASAIRRNDTTAAELARVHEDWSARSQEGLSLLGVAVRHALLENGPADFVRLLLEAGADANERFTTDGDAILIEVLEQTGPASDSIFKMLLDHQGSPDTHDRFGTPILHRARRRLLKMKLLLDYGADINAVDASRHRRGWTAAMSLLADEAYDEVLYLVQRGADLHHHSPAGDTIHSLMEQRRSVAALSGSKLPESFRALESALTVHARTR